MAGLHGQKQMFVSIDINIFLPAADVDKFLQSGNTLEDVLDDDPKSL